MNANVTLTGFVATKPKHTITGTGLAIANFRLGTSERRFDRATGAWVNGDLSWVSVSCFRYLATNVFASVSKGDPVIVTGRLRVREWTAGDKSGLDVEIEAESVGLDLGWGKSHGFERTTGKSGRDADAAADAAGFPDVSSAGAPDLDAMIASARSATAGDPIELADDDVLEPLELQPEEEPAPF